MIKKIMNKIGEHSPEVLVGLGITGMVGSTALAVRATPKVMELMDDKREEVCSNNLTLKEKFEVAWKPYLPAAILGSVSAACIIYGTSINLKRNAALATVYALSETTLQEYQRHTRDIVGEDKSKEIDEAVSKAMVKRREEPKETVIVDSNDSDYLIYTGSGDTLMFDELSGRFFKASVNAVDKAINKTNKIMLDDRYASVNDFYMQLNLPTIEAGDIIGWCCESSALEVRYYSDVTNSGQPFVIMSYINRPIPLSKRYY